MLVLYIIQVVWHFYGFPNKCQLPRLSKHIFAQLLIPPYNDEKVALHYLQDVSIK